MSLWSHAVAVTSDVPVSHQSLGKALSSQGKYEEAIVHFAEVVRINPRSSGAHYNWGNTLGLLGRYDEAIAHYAEAVRLEPDLAEAHGNWGNALVLQGKYEEAQRHFLEALRLKPDDAETRIFQGNLLVLQGRIEEAITRYLEAVKIEPHNAEGHYYLGGALARQRGFAAATAQLRLALEFKPDYAAAANDLAWILATETNATIRNVDEAIRLATRACELTTNQEALYLDTLGAAYAESGRFAEAMATAQQAVTVARAGGDAGLAARLEQRLIDYRARRPESSSLPPAGGPDQKR